MFERVEGRESLAKYSESQVTEIERDIRMVEWRSCGNQLRVVYEFTKNDLRGVM